MGGYHAHYTTNEALRRLSGVEACLNSYPITTDGRICTGCQQSKAATAFGRDPGDKTGLRARCNDCRRIDRQAAPNAAYPPAVDTKHCIHCATTKAAIDFGKEPRNRDGLSGRCLDCARAYGEAYYIENADKIKESTKEYQEKNKDTIRVNKRLFYQKNRLKMNAYKVEWTKRQDPNKLKEQRKIVRARMYWNNPEHHRNYVNRRNARKRANGGSFTAEEWETLCARYDYRCLACGKQKRLTIDHVLPITLGGSSYIENIQPLCHPCNSGKHNRHIDYRINSPYEVR
jgi:5-methylcytosine-specific restriction endonuclease McrA